MVSLDVIGEMLSRDPQFVVKARSMMRDIQTESMSSLDAVDIIKFAFSFAWENGRLEK